MGWSFVDCMTGNARRLLCTIRANRCKLSVQGVRCSRQIFDFLLGATVWVPCILYNDKDVGISTTVFMETISRPAGTKAEIYTKCVINGDNSAYTTARRKPVLLSQNA